VHFWIKIEVLIVVQESELLQLCRPGLSATNPVPFSNRQVMLDLRLTQKPPLAAKGRLFKADKRAARIEEGTLEEVRIANGRPQAGEDGDLAG
jgi:hypothetical protein